MSPTLFSLALAALHAHAVPTHESAAERDVRLRATARDAVVAVEAAAPLPGLTREASLRLLLATAVVESAGLLPEVDGGTARGDHGRSVCLMQINVGRGHVQSPHPLVASWRAADLLADRSKCFRAGLEAARWSMERCGAMGLRGADTLAAYVTGRCASGLPTTRHRWFLAERMALASVPEVRVCRWDDKPGV